MSFNVLSCLYFDFFFYVLVAVFCTKVRSTRTYNKTGGTSVRVIRVIRWKKILIF